MERLKRTERYDLFAFSGTVTKLGKSIPKPFSYDREKNALLPKARFANIRIESDKAVAPIKANIFAFDGVASVLKEGLSGRFVILKDRHQIENKNHSVLVAVKQDKGKAINDFPFVQKNLFNLVNRLGFFVTTTRLKSREKFYPLLTGALLHFLILALTESSGSKSGINDALSALVAYGLSGLFWYFWWSNRPKALFDRDWFPFSTPEIAEAVDRALTAEKP